MPDDLFSHNDHERLKLAGWWPVTWMPGYWRSADGDILAEEEALRRLDAGSGEGEPGPAGE